MFTIYTATNEGNTYRLWEDNTGLIVEKVSGEISQCLEFANKVDNWYDQGFEIYSAIEFAGATVVSATASEVVA